jgi:hypothetical protein
MRDLVKLVFRGTTGFARHLVAGLRLLRGTLLGAACR